MAQKLEPTVKPATDFDPTIDAVGLRVAMKGLGTNEPAIIDVLTSRTNAQRQIINKAFTDEFERDLIKDLKSELSGDFKHLVLALMMPPAEYLSHELHRCLEAKKPDEHTLVEILCTRNRREIVEIAEAYEKEFKRPLAEHMRTKTSGDFRRLLTLIVTSSLQGPRNDETSVDAARAREDAQKLHKAEKTKWGTDEDVFSKILAQESFSQLRLVFEEYKKISNCTVQQTIDAMLEGELKEALLAIVECVVNAPAWFAARLRKAMQGLGTDDRALIRIIVSRSEIDLGAIKREYKRLYDKTLESDIKSDTSGDYRTTLISLLGPD